MVKWHLRERRMPPRVNTLNGSQQGYSMTTETVKEPGKTLSSTSNFNCIL